MYQNIPLGEKDYKIFNPTICFASTKNCTCKTSFLQVTIFDDAKALSN
jgi:hypothetical protein